MKQTTHVSASDVTSCSASSGTPETVDAYKQRDGEGAMDHEIRRARTMEKLERQRNAAWETLREIRELLTADESFGATVEVLFAKPLEEAEAEIARLESLLNVQLIHGEEESPNSKKDVARRWMERLVVLLLLLRCVSERSPLVSRCRYRKTHQGIYHSQDRSREVMKISPLLVEEFRPHRKANNLERDLVARKI